MVYLLTRARTERVCYKSKSTRQRFERPGICRVGLLEGALTELSPRCARPALLRIDLSDIPAGRNRRKRMHAARLRKDLVRILSEAGFSGVRFQFSHCGGRPKMPVVRAGVSFGLTRAPDLAPGGVARVTLPVAWAVRARDAGLS